MKRILTATLAGLAALSAAHAHHAVAPFFDQDTTVEVAGTVRTWIFKNPHPVLVIETPAEGGTTVQWQVHFAPASLLAKRGWTAATFKAGDQVVATGHPSRQPGTRGLEHRGLRRADGSPIVP
jgi:hypothetical protein